MNPIVYGKNKEADAKCIIGYKTDKIFSRLFIMLPQMTGFFSKFEKSQYKSFVIEDQKLLKKYESIWNRISDIIREKFVKQFVYKIKK